MACARCCGCKHIGIIIPLGIGCFFIIFSYALLSINDDERHLEPIHELNTNFYISYRSFYDFALVFTHSFICVICCYYLWNNHEEQQALLAHNESEFGSASFIVNFRKDSWSKLKAIYLYEMELEWNEFNIAAIIYFIHQILTFLLLLGNVIHSHKHPGQDILTALGFLVEGLSIVLLSICLNAEHNPHFFMNRERMAILGGRHHHQQHGHHHDKYRVNVMNNTVIIFMVLVAILCEFFQFLTYPSVNHDSFTLFITETYNCEEAENPCSLRAHFVVNELIFRVFVGVTLLNLIFFLLSVLFGEHPHYPSFGGAKSLIRPCWFTVFLIFEIVEIAFIQDNYKVDMMVNNIFWMVVNSFGCVLCVYHTVNHIKTRDAQRNQWDKLNIATKYEGLLLLVLRTVSIIFVFYDEYEQQHEDWTVYRQIVITGTMYFHMATLWLLKKPAFIHDGVQNLLKFITYINAYNLVFSLIFETSHFLELLAVEEEYEDGDHSDHGLQPHTVAASAHGNQSYFLVSFSTSFAIAHSNLWFLSQFWEWTQHKADRSKMSDSRHTPIPLETPSNQHQISMASKSIPIIRRDEYNTFHY